MKLENGVYIHIQKSDKFKDVGISLRFMAPLSKETVTKRSLLAMMMCDRCKAYPTKKAMSDKQDYLYGTTLQAQTVGYGRAQVLEIRIKMVDPRYTKCTTLRNDVLDYLYEVIFQPLLNEEVFQESKSILKNKMQRMLDDPSQYVITKGLHMGGQNTPLALSSLGELTDLDQITLSDIHEIYEQLMKENRIDILICGHVDEHQMIDLMKQKLPFSPRQVDYPTHYTFASDGEPKKIQETRDIKQCSIFMLWQTNTDICDSDYYALRVANAMFGQYPTSLLFQEVREKHSLCYSIFANLISFDGAMGVTTGVEKQHIEQAMDLVMTQFERICMGDFDNHLLEVSKTMMINSLKATKDAMNPLIAQIYQNAILHRPMTIDERINAIQVITKEDIQHVFHKCQYRLGFVLSGEENK